ncbi:putative RNA helicase [Dioscorea sansibarensis]
MTNHISTKAVRLCIVIVCMLPVLSVIIERKGIMFYLLGVTTLYFWKSMSTHVLCLVLMSLSKNMPESASPWCHSCLFSTSFQFGGIASDWILPFHSSLSSADQRKVFLSPPENIRKVIITTDIAETSITIDDVTYVVDTGKHKENCCNPQKKMTSMFEEWVSQANAKQRRERVGRVKPGVCFCLYKCHRFESLMRPFQWNQFHHLLYKKTSSSKKCLTCQEGT